MTTTENLKHTHGANFGRKVEGCGRCAQLAAGAAPVEWAGTRRARVDAQIIAENRRHFTGTRHLSGGCGPVCTWGDW
jgi:hypothetical protein